MAVRIPTYERRVQLDAGAQTLPRFSADLSIGKGLKEAGSALAQVAAHWRAKQDSHDRLNMHQQRGLLLQQIQIIEAEELTKFDPAKDSLGALHERINARVGQAVAQFQAQAPAHLADDYKMYGNSAQQSASQGSAHAENMKRNEYGKKQLDQINSQLVDSVKKNPDSINQAVAQIRKAMVDIGPVSGHTDAQKRIMDEAYLNQLAKAATEGFERQGRQEQGKVILDQFIKDRVAEEKAQRVPAPGVPSTAPAAPGARKPGEEPKTGQPAAPTGPGPQSRFTPEETGTRPLPAAAGGTEPPARPQDALNQSRIAEIDGKPQIKAAIEKVAAETGMDANMLKVAASIESSGNPKAKSKSGDHVGLFQLTTAEQGMHGGGDRTDPEANARAFVGVLKRNEPLLTNALGRPPTNQELYLSHNQGVGGTVAHIQNPNQPAWKTLLATTEGKEKGEAWAKAAVKGNVPADVLKRLYDGDATRVSSADFVAIKGTQVSGGGIDEAVTTARMQPPEVHPAMARQVVVASADGSVISDTRPPTYLGGMNVGGAPTDDRVIAGVRQAHVPGQTFGRSATAGAQPFRAIVAHYTGGDSLDSALSTLKGDPSRGGKSFGYHFYIDKDGTVVQGAPLDARTNHVRSPGESTRTARPDISNNNAIGVSFVGTGKPTPEQLQSAHALTAHLQQRYNIPAENVVGHGQIQGGSRHPDEAIELVNLVRSGTPAPAFVGGRAGTVQVAGPGAPTGPTTPGGVPLSRWEQLGVTINNRLDGSTMKAASQAHDFKTSLEGRVRADIVTTQLNGKGITMPKELQDYYKHPTPELSFDLIASKLGTATAIKWQQEKDYAQKIYNGGANMEDMTRAGIVERLKSIKPDENSPYYPEQAKVYNEVLKKAQKINNDRNADPAGYADKHPAVAAALEEARKDPRNPEKIQALITARMSRQEHLQIDPALRTPISNEQARILAQPLLDRARPNRDTAGTEVAKSVVEFVGKATAEGIPDLAQRALQTVLKEKKITNDQAAATADALVQAQHPAPSPLTPNDGKPKNYDLSYMSKDGYFFGYSPELPAYIGRQDEPSADYADPPFAEAASFQPGTKFIPAKHIEQLLKDPTLATVFDEGSSTRPGYGPGAAKYFLEGGKNVPTISPLSTPTPEQEKQDIFDSPIPLPAQPDVLTQPPTVTVPEEETTEEGAQ